MKLFSLRAGVKYCNLFAIVRLVVVLIMLGAGGKSWGQTTVFSDAFATSAGTAYSTTAGAIGTSATWSMARSAADFGAKIDAGFLNLTNDGSASGNADGWVYGYTATGSFISPYNTTLNAITGGIVSWTFNMRQIRIDPAGFGVGAYGVAFILGGTSSTPATVGSGYAVVLGQSGTTDPVRLVRYNNGLQGTLTNIITSNTTGLSDFGAEYLSCKVTYTQATNAWELFLRNDGATTFADPAVGTLVSQGTATNNTYTNTPLTGMGGYWQGSTAANQTAFFDNVTVKVCTSTQTITALATPVAKTYGDAAYSAATTSSSSLAVTYASSDAAVSTVDASGTVTITGAGTATITASQAGNGTYCAAPSVTQVLTVSKKSTTITGLTANDKTYDGNMTATLSGTAALSGLVSADVANVALGGTPSASFADALAGTNKPVTVTGYTISGTASGNYTLTQPSGLTATINAPANSIDLSPASQSFGAYCNATANSIAVVYTTTGTVTAPFIQLSNSLGSFSSGTTNLGGTVTGSGTYTITGSIPVATGAGTAYRVRIVSTDATPIVSTTNNGSGITIYAQPSVAANAGGAATVCLNAATVAFTNTTAGGTWSINSGTGMATVTTGGVVTGTGAGTIDVWYTVTNGTCTNTASSSLIVNALPANPNGSISGSSPACSSTNITYTLPSASEYWQTVTNGTSTAQSTTTAYNVTTTGTYYVRAYDGTCWSAGETSLGTLVINQPVNIGTQPTNKSVTSPAGTSFSITASNVVGYQWQVDDGTGWANVVNSSIYSGTATATLTLSTTAENMDGYGYRVVITAGTPCLAFTSSTVSLAVAPGPCGTESFQNMPASSGTYATRTWAGDNGGTWIAGKARTDRTMTLRAITLEGTTGSVITSPTITTGMGILSFDYVRDFTGTGSRTLQVFVNGVQIGSDIIVSPSSNAIVNYSNNVDVSGNVVLELRTSGSQVKIDNISWKCYTQCNPTATVTSFLPATGPVGTRVTITGTGFTGATAVAFGGVSATSFTLVSSTTITAQVPAGAISGNVSVTVGGCPAKSATVFALIEPIGCGSGSGNATDLLVSEVYDAESGSLGYIEIFNGTANPVNLSSYTIRIRTGSSTDNDYPMTGPDLASGAVYILRVGTSSSGTCSGFTINDNQSTASGFNGNDQIFLLKSGSVLDYAPNPNATGAGGSGAEYVGFSQIRHSNVTIPTGTYTALQWTNSGTESCSDLGHPPFVPNSSSVSISPQPSDYTACSVPISFTATSTGSGAGSNATLWKFYNPYTDAWELASGVASLTQLYSTITTATTNTPNMTISGNVAQLQNYQFYAEVTRNGSTGCVVASNAVHYTYNTAPHYRSNIIAGNWSNPASWEMSTDNATWNPACSYPIAINSDDVIVRDGHIITLDTKIDIDKVTINRVATPGELVIGASSSIKVLNGQTGADLIVNGNLTDNGNTQNGIDFEDNSGTANDASWTLGNSATIVKTNGGSSGYRDFYETGIANISANANWVYRKAITNPILYVASGTTTTPMYYPNLTLENTFGGTYASGINPTPDLSTFTFIGNNNPIYILGNFDVGGSAAYNVNFSNINTASQVTVGGNMTIKSGSTLTNIGGTNYGTGFEIKGSLANAGVLTSQHDAVNGASGKLNLTGTSAQTVSGSGAFNLYDFTVENSGTGSVEMQSDILVPNQLTLNNGVVTTHVSPNGLLTLGSATNSVNGSLPGLGTYAYINGPMAKKFVKGTINEFLYPIGKSTAPVVYKPAGLKPVAFTGNDTTFMAEYFNGPHPANAAMGSTVLAISNLEYWEISKFGVITGSNTAKVKLFYKNPGSGNWIRYNPAPVANAVYDPCIGCNVAVVHRDAITDTWDFTAPAAGFNSSDPEYRYFTDEGAIYSAATPSFSPFTLAYSYNIILLLPVNLLSFTGQLVVADGKLNWKVADSKDLDGFELEYSRDGHRYENLVAIKSNGGNEYSFLHAALPAGTNYYRLLVKDKNGKTFYSQVVLLNVGKLHTYLVGVTPTIVSGELIPVIFSAKNQQVQAMITDVLGRRISNEKSILQPGSNQWRINTQSLAKGMYFITLLTEDGLKETRKFIKE